MNNVFESDDDKEIVNILHGQESQKYIKLVIILMELDEEQFFFDSDSD